MDDGDNYDMDVGDVANDNGKQMHSSSSSSSSARFFLRGELVDQLRNEHQQRSDSLEQNQQEGESLNANETDQNRRGRATVRQRIELMPLDVSLRQSRLMRKMTEVNIDDLANDEAIFKMNLNRNYIDVQLVRVITPNKDQKANVYGIRRRNGGANQDVHFNRLFLCRIHSTRNLEANSRLLYLMEANGCNNMLFERNLELRDNGTISIGTFFRILAPLPIENNMKGDIPLIKTQLPVIVMETPSRIPTVSINNQLQENTSVAFVMNNVFLNINRTVPIQTTCSGFLCDKQRVNDWSGSRGCGCYHMTQYRSNIVFQHTIFFDTTGGDRIVHSDFSSTKFSLLYLSNHIPGAVRVSALRVSDSFWDLEDSIEKVVEKINEDGGWTVVGWYKRGVITDKSLLSSDSNTTANNMNSSNVEVGSGNVNYHVVQLIPTNRNFLDSSTEKGKVLDELKFDVSNINHHQA